MTGPLGRSERDLLEDVKRRRLRRQERMRSTHSGLSSSLTDLDHAQQLAAGTGSI